MRYAFKSDPIRADGALGLAPVARLRHDGDRLDDAGGT